MFERLEKERPLFCLHLGDLSHGHAFECEAVRAAFDRAGIPIFVAPGNHDAGPFPARSLENFHRAMNPAPVAFTVGDVRFALLDVADFPIRQVQVEWLEREAAAVAAVGSRSLWVCLHRPPVDPLNRGSELPAKDGADDLARILKPLKSARTYGAHLGGYYQGTFAGHPFVMSSGGGEIHSFPDRNGEPFHFLLVPLSGGEHEFVGYEHPSFFAGMRSRLAIMAPVFLGRWRAGFLAAVVVALVALAVERRRSG
jgi:hypothetical protein